MITKLRIAANPDAREHARLFVGDEKYPRTIVPNRSAYDLAFELASHMTGGAITFVRRDGTVAPVAERWNGPRWMAEYILRGAAPPPPAVERGCSNCAHRDREAIICLYRCDQHTLRGWYPDESKWLPKLD